MRDNAQSVCQDSFLVTERTSWMVTGYRSRVEERSNTMSRARTEALGNAIQECRSVVVRGGTSIRVSLPLSLSLSPFLSLSLLSLGWSLRLEAVHSRFRPRRQGLSISWPDRCGSGFDPTEFILPRADDGSATSSCGTSGRKWIFVSRIEEAGQRWRGTNEVRGWEGDEGVQGFSFFRSLIKPVEPSVVINFVVKGGMVNWILYTEKLILR